MNRVAAEGDLPFTQPADSSDRRSYMRLASDNSWPPEIDRRYALNRSVTKRDTEETETVYRLANAR